MTSEQWQQVKNLFHSALALAPEKRAAYLDEACRDKDSLRAEVETLIAAHQKSGSFIDSPAYEEAAHTLVDAASELEKGQQVGAYEILSLLGRGGMGEVYLARDTRLQRNVALKFLPASYVQDAERLRRFEREARAASALNHPNIITIHEVGGADLSHYIATEFVEGETLRERLARVRLDISESLQIAIQIADALAAAHKAGIIHRDIKPENIMIRPDGYVKILDFGLAKLMGQDSASSRLEASSRKFFDTSPGMIIGTASYMSPEQARGLEVDARTDIWSLGCVLHEMITGESPFAGRTVSDTIANVLAHEPPLLIEHVPDVPSGLQDLIRKTLQKDCEHRYQSGTDLLLDLRSLKQDLELSRLGGPAKRQFNSVSELGLLDSLAVLPFTNSSSNADAEYLSDGITESIINSLARLPQLTVMARSTVFRYKEQYENLQRIGASLNVKAILTGRVSQRGDVLVVNVELVKVANGSQLWGQLYKRKMADILEVQEEISTEISEKLRLRLTGAEQQELTRRYTDNSEAYQLYLKGRYWWNKRMVDDMKKAIAYFDQAIEVDPSYALAYAGLSDCYAMLGIYSLPPKESFPKAKAAAQKALEIDERLAEAHASLGFTHLYYDWDLEASELELRRALELNPGYASAHQWLGFCLGLTSRVDEALAEMKIAQQLDPFSASINYTAAWPAYWDRRYDTALSQFQAAVELHPGFWATHYWLGLAYEQTGQISQAIAALEKARTLGDTPWRLAGLGHAYALAGRRSDALGVIEELTELSRHQYVSAHNFAVVYSGLGQTEEALVWLEKAYDQRAWLLVWLHVDPLFDGVRANSKFVDLLNSIGLHENGYSTSRVVVPKNPERVTSLGTTADTTSEIQCSDTANSGGRGRKPSWNSRPVVLIILALILVAGILLAHKSLTSPPTLIVLYKALSTTRHAGFVQSDPAAHAQVMKVTQVTTSDSLDLSPTFSPDGNSIAYSSDRTGSFEIYVRPLVSGGREFQLTSDGKQNLYPAWSPDGKMIAYHSQAGGGLRLIPALGGTARQLTDFGSRPSWSRDSTQIAFQSDGRIDLGAMTGVAQAPSTIWVVPGGGGEAKQITQPGEPPGGHGAPAWSPDGSHIVFCTGEHQALWAASLRGGQLKRLTPKLGGVFGAVYSPDGGSIYYSAVKDANFGLWKTGVSPEADVIGDPVMLTNTGSASSKYLSISADGSRLAYSAVLTKSNLWSLPISRGTDTAIGAASPLTTGTNLRNVYPVFSPDGRKIAYAVFRTGADSNIWVMDADGKNQTQVTTDTSYDSLMNWFPDSDQIAFVSAREGEVGIWTTSVKGGRERLLLRPGENISYARVSPDGKWVVFNSNQSGAINLWIASIEDWRPRQLTFDKELMGFPFWSPDGRFIAFMMKRGDDTHVATIPKEGGTPTQLTSDRGLSFAADWSPDGNKLVFAGQRNGIWNVYWIARETREQKKLTNYTELNSYVRYPAWSPLDNQIVYEYAETTGNIWIADLK